MKNKRMIWVGGLFLLLVAGISAVAMCTTEKPPVEEMEVSRKVLAEAEKMNAEIYSHSLYRDARSLYDSAMQLWKQENEKLILWRRYDSVRSLATQSLEKARKAIKRAAAVQQDTREETREEIALLRKEMKTFEKLFASLPLGKKIVSQHSQGKLLLNGAEIAFEKEDYNAGRQKSRQAAALIRSSYRSGREMLKEYFERLPEWQKRLENFVDESEKNREYAIVVVKIPATCMIYYKGEKKFSFPVEFGKNWLGEKRCEGDYATPEGEYRVVKRLQAPMTRYYKALLLDYPNAADRINFEKLKKNGDLPRNARPGGLIEIHGEGGKGANWTNGCVALENEDMSVLYRYVSKGTPVLIIGAEEEMKNEE